jgi:glycosyltransferase involved in cell wall biosynthesis
VPTEDLARELAFQGFADLKVVSRGVDTRLFHPRQRSMMRRRDWGVEEDSPVLIMVSRVAPEKNFPLAIRAFRALQAHLPQARMVIVGDGPQRQALARANPDIHFAGMQTGQALAEHYASADLFVFSSLSETFGNVTLEAMASGLPVVAYRYAAAKQHVLEGETGLLASPGDELDFIQAVQQLGMDVHACRSMGTAARLVADELGWEQICLDFEAALLAVAE